VFYMVSALRYAMTGYQEVHISLALLFTGLSLTAMVALNLYLLKKGTGLRD
jgi:ABC-2 type transport system permease protein